MRWSVVAEADRLGLELCFHNCAGWSSSGGPWISPENAMQVVVASETRVSGGAHFDGVLTQPPTKCGYYRDIAVLAFPTPSANVLIEDLEQKTCGLRALSQARAQSFHRAL